MVAPASPVYPAAPKTEKVNINLFNTINMKKQIRLSGILAGGIIAVISAVMMSCGTAPEPKAYNQGINIIPIPVELTENEGAFTLNKKTVIVCGCGNCAAGEKACAEGGNCGAGAGQGQCPKQGGKCNAAYLVAKIKASTGYDLKVVTEKPAKNYIAFAKDPQITNPEGYTFVSTPEGVTITGGSCPGVFYGIQTLLQLLPAEIESPVKVTDVAWTVPAVSIKDEPRFEYRGMHLDVCRHFIPIDRIKKHVDVMSMFKYNKLHWHLTEDQLWTIEIKKYPELKKGSTRIEGDGSTYGGFYTQEEIKDLIAYAAQRHVEIIPEIEMPGHAKAALVSHPELSCTGGPFDNPRILWGVEDDVYCAGNEAVFEFLENVLREVAELFPSQYIHIGGDECPKVRWQKCPKCQARIKELGLASLDKRTDAFGKIHTPEEALQSYFISRIDKFVNEELGKTIIGWDEILEGGLAPSAIVMSWRGEDGGVAAASLNHRAIMTPNSAGFYLDHYQGAEEVEPVSIGGFSTLEKVYQYNPIPKDLPEDKHQYIWGAQGNNWTEYMLTPDHVEYMAYPRAVAISEVVWSPLDRKNWDCFTKRFENAMVRMDMHKINYHIPLPEGTLVDILEFTEGSVSVPFSNTRNYDMVYTLDGTEPTAASEVYTEPLTIGENTTVKVATRLPHGKLSKVRTIEVKKQELRPATDIADPLFKPGTKMELAEGLYVTDEQVANAPFAPAVPMNYFGRSTPVGQSSPEKTQFNIEKPSLAVYSGFVELPEDGVYGFATDMDELWIDGELLIKNGQESASRFLHKKTTRAMAKGKHEYKMVFNNMTKHGWPNGWNHIAFWTKAPGEKEYTRVAKEQLTYVQK